MYKVLLVNYMFKVQSAIFKVNLTIRIIFRGIIFNTLRTYSYMTTDSQCSFCVYCLINFSIKFK